MDGKLDLNKSEVILYNEEHGFRQSIYSILMKYLVNKHFYSSDGKGLCIDPEIERFEKKFFYDEYVD